MMKLKPIVILCTEFLFMISVFTWPVRGNPPSLPDKFPDRSKVSDHTTNNQKPSCNGIYANDISLLTLSAREKEQNTRYTYCIRSQATYHCPFYNSEGKLWKKNIIVSAHGTAFSYRHQKNSTLLLTNEHVAEWPFVTDNDNPVQDVPSGCKLSSQKLSIVDDDKDNYALDDIKLQRIISDSSLDISILKAPVKLPVIPFRLGQSAALKQGNAVHVRGYPLGAFQAVNYGKVINPYDHDQWKKWDHIDFVFDALLSDGHSGSPVLAVSCATGDYELVGIYHAIYKSGSALNVAVSIDEIRDLITTLQHNPKRKRDDALTRSERDTIVDVLKTGAFFPLIPFGSYSVSIRLNGDVLLYDFLSKKHPLLDYRLIRIEDLPSSGFGRVGKIWFGGEYGMKEYQFSDLDQNEQAVTERLLKSLQKHFFNIYRYRSLSGPAHKSRIAYDKMRQLEREISADENQRRELINMMAETAKSRAPGSVNESESLPAVPAPAEF